MLLRMSHYSRPLTSLEALGSNGMMMPSRAMMCRMCR